MHLNGLACLDDFPTHLLIELHPLGLVVVLVEVFCFEVARQLSLPEGPSEFGRNHLSEQDVCTVLQCLVFVVLEVLQE